MYLSRTEHEFIATQNERIRLAKPFYWRTQPGGSIHASRQAPAIDEEEAEVKADLNRKGWHNARICGNATPLDVPIAFPERDSEIKYSLYPANCIFEFDSFLTPLQDDHDSNVANILGLYLKFKIGDEEFGGLRHLEFDTSHIPRNEATNELMDQVAAGWGGRALTCSLSARIQKSHAEYRRVGYPEKRVPVQIVDECFVDHIELIVKSRNAFPWEPLARAPFTSATIYQYR